MKLSALMIAAALLPGASDRLVPTLVTERPAYTYETALRERFDDPASVVFRNVRQAADGRAYCGEVNGLDRHGALIGFRQFVVYGGHGAYMVLIGTSEEDQLACE